MADDWDIFCCPPCILHNYSSVLVCTVAESQHNIIVSLGEQLITIDALMCTISFVLKTLQDKVAQLVNW
jgi:hypothetical protein